MTYSLQHFIILGTILFFIGLGGIIVKRSNIIGNLLSLELMLLAANINFVAYSSYLGNLDGQIFSIFILTIAAAESAVALAIIVCYFKNKNTININDINELKG